MTLDGDKVARELQAGDPTTIGPYRLVGQLGRGGMGRVFLGVSAGGRPVAVKVIRTELASDPQFRRRFAQEVAAARRVNGLFTAMVIDADVDGQEPWLATAYVPGPSLTEAVADHGPLPAQSLLALAAGLAESLNAIHAAGVVHRDLKPSNVLLAQDGPRVIDFGISRAVETTSLTQAGLVIGSPGFMSPEQAEGFDVGPPSDIFSLGAVLVYAAAGQGPFGTGTTAAMLYRIVHGEPHLSQLPPEVRPLVERCLAKNPVQRPTAGGVLAEVGALQPSGGWLPDSIVRAIGQEAPATAPAGASGFVSAAFHATQASYPGLAPSAESRLLAPGASRAPVTAAPVTAASGRVPPTPLASPPVAAPLPPADAYPVPPPPLSAPPDSQRPRRRRRAPVLVWVFSGAIVVGAGIGIVLTAVTGHPSKTPLQSRPAALTTAPTTGSSVRGVTSSQSGSPSPARSVSSSPSPSSIAGVVTSTRPSPAASVHPSKSPTASASPSPSPSSSPASPSPSASPTPTPSPTPSPSPSTTPTSTPSTSTSASTVASTSPSSSAST